METKETDKTEEKGHWWCDECKTPTEPTRVTFEECHDKCGHPVRWIDFVAKEQQSEKVVTDDAWNIVHLIDSLHYADKDYQDGTSTKSEWHKRKAKYIKDYASQAVARREGEIVEERKDIKYILEFALQVIEDNELENTTNKENWIIGKTLEKAINLIQKH